MNIDDIKRMVQESNFIVLRSGIDAKPLAVMNYEHLEKFASLVAAAEREACAQAAEAVVPRHTECGNKIAVVIRARGQS